ncbi:hypothetical protein HT585_24385 [Ensifer sp. HO-A22]|uniref:DUF2946 domain-containing protein n=1 Tax=Ensifer oleiphilus TaxID=2742698 RepID=A0A7Y6QAC0_9HYPH|nr:hypothetical protein [Ensifer oleiphilus]NVD42008.1 hypothetical protein [Ensifer oleiphilus]
MQQAMRMFGALAVLLLGFAHQAPAAAAALSPAERAQFVLPDGSLPDLCLPGAGNDDGNGKQLSHSHFCGACRIFWALPPAPAGATDTIVRKTGKVLPPAQPGGSARSQLPPNASPRGPPASRFHI